MVYVVFWTTKARDKTKKSKPVVGQAWYDNFDQEFNWQRIPPQCTSAVASMQIYA